MYTSKLFLDFLQSYTVKMIPPGAHITTDPHRELYPALLYRAISSRTRRIVLEHYRVEHYRVNTFYYMELPNHYFFLLLLYMTLIETSKLLHMHA